MQKHLEEYGELPSISTVIQNTDNFEATDSPESVETLAKKLTDRNLKNAAKDFFVKTANAFGDLSGIDILEQMEHKVEEFRKLSSKKGKDGVDWSVSGTERQAEYEQRKAKDFSRRIPFFFNELTDALGEMNGGYYLTIMAFTSKGKTWLGLLQALKAHMTGLNVLVESGEMSKPEVQFRLDTLAGGFNNRGLFTGALDFRDEEAYRQWLSQYNPTSGKTPLAIKTQEDWARGLSIEQIEHDLQTHKPDVLIIDQFSLIRHQTSDRSGMTNTSRRLKELAGKYGIVVVLLYQANGDYEKRKPKEANANGDEALKELIPPRISDYSETIAVIQDSDAILTFDSTTWRDQQSKRQCGKALLFVAKSRAGGEGTELEMNWIPNEGVIETKKATDIF
ncbi:MAG: AAA family ATPase [Peptococcaceae bacterium]|nr:AAA family ATPase [Peptococcaceae bacterium]